ncbi:M81 family metallopeptidase [Rhizobium sp. 2MFCol3.1]|uniref:M81 family metallopeptidase n=1 Tax=Rhizobium sp. 2MFCol3.1 TaxID=1246459 RepID=UPI00036A4523|nr:M81 family metallopeptidase [Rhizobium sp. 2MFCol3.1]
MNILIAGFQHETNTFAPTKATYASFLNGEDFPSMAHGQDVLKLADVNIPIGGFIKHVTGLGHSVTPVVWAGAGASAHTTTDAYERIAGEIIEGVKHLTYDAIYLDLHGAQVTEDLDDGEGELVSRVRSIVGPDVKIVVSLDSHANVTDLLWRVADAVVAYRTYPHVDMAETGVRAAKLLLHLQASGKPLALASRRLPFLIPVNAMSTMLQPARGMYDFLEELETDVVSLSFAPGFPASDFAECGPTVWGYDDDSGKIDTAVEALYNRVLDAETAWSVEFEKPDDAVLHAMHVAASAGKPVILADTQDNPGVGGTSNTTGILKSLLRNGAKNAALGLMCDPVAAAAAHKAGVGAQIEIALGGCAQVPGDTPLVATFTVENLSDGKLVYGGPMMHGKQAELGPSAQLKIDGVRIVVTSNKAQLLDRNMYRAVGIEPENMSILVNKSSVHFRADFSAIAEQIIVVEAPGPFSANPADLPWRNLREGIRLSPNGKAFAKEVAANQAAE